MTAPLAATRRPKIVDLPASAPHDPTIERGALGLSLVNAADFATMRAAGITAGDFHLEPHRRIWRVLEALELDGLAPSFVNARARLTSHDDPMTSLLVELGEEGRDIPGRNGETAAELARQLLDFSARRRGLEYARALHDDLSTGRGDPARLLAETAQALDVLGRSSGMVGRFAAAAETASHLIAREVEQPPSIVGEGLVVAGLLSILFGPAFAGKSMLTLRMALDVSRGEPLLGIPTIPTTRCRVAIVSLELPSFHVRKRLLDIAGARRDGLDDIEVIAHPALHGPVDILDPRTLHDLIGFCRERSIGFLIADPLARLHSLDENAASEAGRVCAAFEALAQKSGAGVLFVHHTGHGDPKNPGAAHPRGSTRFLSDPVTALELREERGCRALMAKHVNLGPSWDHPVYLKRLPSGVLEVTERPLDAKEQAEAIRNEIDALLTANAAAGLKVEEIRELLPANPATGKPYAPATVARHLTALEVEGRARRREKEIIGAADVWLPAGR